MKPEHVIAALRAIRASAVALVSSIDAAILTVQASVHVQSIGGPDRRMDRSGLQSGPPMDGTATTTILGDDPENTEDSEIGAAVAAQSIGGPDRRMDRSGLQSGPRDGLKAAMAAAWDGCGGVSINGKNRQRIGDCAPLLRRIAAEQGRDPIQVFTAAVARFKSDPNVLRERFGLAVFLSQLEAWCAELPEADREEVRQEHMRKLRIERDAARAEIDLARTDAQRAHWERRASELNAALDKLAATRAA